MERLFLGARLALAALALGAAGCNSMFYYPSRHVYSEPEKLGIAYSDHFFRTRSGVKLHGRVLRHPDTAAYRGLFVHFHGNAENLTSHYLQYAWVLRRGYDLFVFDYPGYGASEGEAARPGTVEAGAAALQWVSDSLLPAPPAHLVVVGASLGGAVMLRCLPEWKARNRATLVVAESTFPSYRGAARSALSKHWLTWTLQPMAYVLVSETDSPTDFIPRISPAPLLVAACREDRVVDYRITARIYRLAGTPSWFWDFSGCGHLQSFQAPSRRDSLMALIDSLGAVAYAR